MESKTKCWIIKKVSRINAAVHRRITGRNCNKQLVFLLSISSQKARCRRQRYIQLRWAFMSITWTDHPQEVFSVIERETFPLAFPASVVYHGQLVLIESGQMEKECLYGTRQTASLGRIVSLTPLFYENWKKLFANLCHLSLGWRLMKWKAYALMQKKTDAIRNIRRQYVFDFFYSLKSEFALRVF